MPEADNAPAMRLGEAVTTTSAIAVVAGRLRKAGVEAPEREARLVVAEACGLSREELILRVNDTLNAMDLDGIERIAERRIRREPLSRILGKRGFWRHDFLVGPAVLDPRPDTETLVEAALAIIDAEGRRCDPIRLLDLGTGSGCILLSLLAELPNGTGVGVDIEAGALEIARQNARRLEVQDRSDFIHSDWCKEVGGTFDLILSNPPYIRRDEIEGLAPEVRDHDPAVALDGGPDGYAAYRAIAENALRLCSAGGWVLLEAGMGQADKIAGIFADAGWCGSEEASRFYHDLSGINRVVAIKRQQWSG